MNFQNIKNTNLDSIFEQINYDIALLYVMPCVYTRHLILKNLKDKMSILESLTNSIEQINNTTKNQSSFQTAYSPITKSHLQLQNSGQSNQKTFTIEELSQYNGKDGSPVYVAINGTVYDITNNPAWAGATHFGLVAGKDLTNEFTICHAEQQILKQLKEVGKLV